MSTSPASFDGRKLFRSVLVMLGASFLLAGIEIKAATITWSGAGGDSLWSNPLNWSGGMLPTSADDVVIDVPGSVTVGMNVPNTTVRSLQCQESFLVENASFTVTAGASVINGAFRTKAAWVAASGPTTVLTLNGTVTNASGLGADSGAVIALPFAQKLTIDGTSQSQLAATGPGSAILLPNLTDLVITPGYFMMAGAVDGGLIDLRRLRVPKGPMMVSAQGSNSMVNLSGMSGLWTHGPEYNLGYGLSYRRNRLSASDGGTVLIPNVTALEKVEVTVVRANVPLAQIRSMSAGLLSLTGHTNGFDALTNFSGLLGAYDNTRLDLTNLTLLNAANSYLSIHAYQGSTIRLPAVTNVVMTAPNTFEVEAGTGAYVDLSGLRATNGPLRVVVNSGGVVDLSGVAGEWYAPGSSVQALSGGLLVIPGVTAMREMVLDLSDDGIVPTAQIRSFSAGTLYLTSRTNGFDALTNFDGTLIANDSRLDWTNFTSLHAINSDVSIKAYQGSVIQLPRVTNVVISTPYRFVVEAGTGGRINLSGLRPQDVPLSVTAMDAGSVVDLSGVTGEWVAAGSVVHVWNGGTLLIPGVTAMRNLSLDLRYDAVLPTANIRSMVDCSLTLYGRTNGFENLTNFTSNLELRYQSRIDWTNFTVLNATGPFLGLSASEGSLIDLSHVTNVVAIDDFGLVSTAFNGGRIDLSRLRQLNGQVSAWASGTNSVVNLSSLSGVLRSGFLRADKGGTVLIPNITALEGGDYDVRGDANISVTHLTSIIDCRLHLERRTNDLAGLTNFTGWLYAVDSRLVLTNLTVLYATNRSLLFDSSEGSVIDLSSVTNVVISPGYLLQLTGNEGRIDLRRARVPEGPLNVDSSGVGGVVDLSGLSGLWTPGPGHANSTVLAWSGGSVLMSNVTAMRRIDLAQQRDAILPMTQLSSFTEGSIQTTARTNVFAALTNFDGSFGCTDGRAEFPVLTRLGATDSTVSFTANAGGVIDLNQVTNPIVGAGNSLILRSLYDGRIALPHVEGIDVSYVEVLASGSGAVVDLSSLTGLFSENNSGSLASRGGGTVLLNTNAILVAGVALDLQSNPGSVLPPYLAAAQSLVLYGRPWESYRVESRDLSVPGGPWTVYARVPLTSPLKILGPSPPFGMLLRVNLMLPDPPELSIRQAGSGQVEVILFGLPGHTYSLSSKTALDAGLWENGPTKTMTNSFHIFPAAGSTNAARFFRASKL